MVQTAHAAVAAAAGAVSLSGHSSGSHGARRGDDHHPDRHPSLTRGGHAAGSASSGSAAKSRTARPASESAGASGHRIGNASTSSSASSMHVAASSSHATGATCGQFSTPTATLSRPRRPSSLSSSTTATPTSSMRIGRETSNMGALLLQNALQKQQPPGSAAKTSKAQTHSSESVGNAPRSQRTASVGGSGALAPVSISFAADSCKRTGSQSSPSKASAAAPSSTKPGKASVALHTSHPAPTAQVTPQPVRDCADAVLMHVACSKTDADASAQEGTLQASATMCSEISSTNAAAPLARKQSRSIRLIEKDPRDEPRTFSVDDIEFLHKLGAGAFSQVFLVQSRTTHAKFALKVLQKDKLTNSVGGAKALLEKDLLPKLHHPGIVHYYGSLQDPFYQYLVLEYIPGRDLFRHVRKTGSFDEHTARFFMAEIVLIIEYLHSIGILYRDLKPENIIVEPSGHLRLVDFGLATNLEGRRTSTFCGTAEYIAPEMLRNEQYALSLDYYGLGVLLFEMLVGRTPFFDSNRATLYDNIQRGHIDWDSYPQVSPTAKDLLCQLLALQPAERLGHAHGTADIKAHPWFASVNWADMERRTAAPPHLRLEAS